MISGYLMNCDVHETLDHGMDQIMDQDTETTGKPLNTFTTLIYRVDHFNPSSRISRKSSPGEKNFSDKSCLVAKGP